MAKGAIKLTTVDNFFAWQRGREKRYELAADNK